MIIDHEDSNKTKYGIESDAERYCWAGFYLFVIFSSLIGDSIILVSSIKHKAIKLHKVMVAIIQHLAVCDLMVVTSHVIPKFISIISNRWMLGESLGYVLATVPYYFNTASNLLISTMTTSKILLLKYPLRFGRTSSKRANEFCYVVWGLALILPVTMIVVDSKDVHFSYVFYSIMYGFSSKRWKFLQPPLTILLGFLPTCLVVATSIYLLIKARQVARRGRESLKWQGITTTFLTATVFCVSWLPYLLMNIMGGFLKAEKEGVYLAALRTVVTLVYLNTMSNFFIYCLTVDSFRGFVWSRLEMLLSLFKSSNSDSEGTIYLRIEIHISPLIKPASFYQN